MTGRRISRNCGNCWRVLRAHDTTEVLAGADGFDAAQSMACFGRMPGVTLARLALDCLTYNS